MFRAPLGGVEGILCASLKILLSNTRNETHPRSVQSKCEFEVWQSKIARAEYWMLATLIKMWFAYEEAGQPKWCVRGESTVREERRRWQKGSLATTHLSLRARGLKLAFSLKKSETHARSSITSEATAGNHAADELIRIPEMVTADHADVSRVATWRDAISSQPQLNLSICNWQILIRTAQYTVHHYELLNCRPQNVHVQESHRMYSNIESRVLLGGVALCYGRTVLSRALRM